MGNLTGSARAGQATTRAATAGRKKHDGKFIEAPERSVRNGPKYGITEA
jgi:hypothetical protein